MTRLAVKVVTNASQDEIAGWYDGALRIRVKAKALKGHANKAVCKLLAKTLHIPWSQITIKTGLTSTRKMLWIEGLNEDDIARLLPDSDVG